MKAVNIFFFAHTASHLVCVAVISLLFQAQALQQVKKRAASGAKEMAERGRLEILILGLINCTSQGGSVCRDLLAWLGCNVITLKPSQAG